MQCSRYELEKLWGKVTSAMSSMQTSQCSWKELQSLIEKVRESFHDYQTSSLSYLDYLFYVGTPQGRQECETIEHIMYNHRKFVDNTIAEGNERKQELKSELGSMRSGSQTSSISSAVLRARARAKAAAAVKKAQMQKKRSVLEAQSALVIQKEKARIEQLCLEEEAAIAIAKANAIDNELGFKSGSRQLDLPEENTSDRVECYFEHQCDEALGNAQQISHQNPHVPPKSIQHRDVPPQISQSEAQQPSEVLPCPFSAVTPSSPLPHPLQGMTHQSQQVPNYALHIPPSLPQSIPQPSPQITQLPQYISPKSLMFHISNPNTYPNSLQMSHPSYLCHTYPNQHHIPLSKPYTSPISHPLRHLTYSSLYPTQYHSPFIKLHIYPISYPNLNPKCPMMY